jgi:hypothetical protein
MDGPPDSGNYKTMADKCRDKAAECEREAERAHVPSIKAAWLDMAKDWRALAAQIEAGAPYASR